MKPTAQLLILLALTAASQAIKGSIQDKLSEIKGLSQIQSEAECVEIGNCSLSAMPPLVLNCPCNITGTIPPVAGTSETQVYSNQVNVAQGQTVNQIPNTA